MILGLKYMLGSTEERASYKKSMIPYIVGAVLLFAAVSLTSLVEKAVGLDDVKVQAPNGGTEGGYDFSKRACSACEEEGIPTFSIEKHTYVCPHCGMPM